MVIALLWCSAAIHWTPYACLNFSVNSLSRVSRSNDRNDSGREMISSLASMQLPELPLLRKSNRFCSAR